MRGSGGFVRQALREHEEAARARALELALNVRFDVAHSIRSFRIRSSRRRSFTVQAIACNSSGRELMFVTVWQCNAQFVGDADVMREAQRIRDLLTQSKLSYLALISAGYHPLKAAYRIINGEVTHGTLFTEPR